MTKYAPTAEVFIERLRESLKYCEEADDYGSIDFEMGRWQEWIKEWPQILTPEGGI